MRIVIIAIGICRLVSYSARIIFENLSKRFFVMQCSIVMSVTVSAAYSLEILRIFISNNHITVIRMEVWNSRITKSS